MFDGAHWLVVRAVVLGHTRRKVDQIFEVQCLVFLISFLLLGILSIVTQFLFAFSGVAHNY
jgi:hypothetical protein